jgi:hypothetical protein
MTDHSGSALWMRPATQLGRWAVGLMVIFVLLFLINGVFMQLNTGSWWQQNLLPFYGILMLLCGLSAGIVGLVAVVKKHERSWMVWVTIFPLAFVIFMVLGEFLGPSH